MVINDAFRGEHDLPWDQVWEYLLGDEEEVAPETARSASAPRSSGSYASGASRPMGVDPTTISGLMTTTPAKKKFGTISIPTQSKRPSHVAARFRRRNSDKQQRSQQQEPGVSKEELVPQQRDPESSSYRNNSPGGNMQERVSVSGATPKSGNVSSGVNKSSTSGRRKSSSSRGIDQREDGDDDVRESNPYPFSESLQNPRPATPFSLSRQSSGASQGSNSKRKIGFWRRRIDDAQETAWKTKETLESCAAIELQESIGESSLPKSSRRSKKSLSERTISAVPAFVSTNKETNVPRSGSNISVEQLEPVVEQRESGSPETTIGSESDGPLLALFLCNGDDHSSVQSSGGCVDASGAARARHSVSNIMREGAPASWGFLDSNSGATDVNSNTATNNNNKSQLPRSSSTYQQRSYKNIKSSASVLPILDSIAKGIDEFLDPNFTPSSTKISTKSASRAVADSKSAPLTSQSKLPSESLGSENSQETATTRQNPEDTPYFSGNKTSTLSPINERPSGESKDSSSSDEENAKNLQNQDVFRPRRSEDDIEERQQKGNDFVETGEREAPVAAPITYDVPEFRELSDKDRSRESGELLMLVGEQNVASSKSVMTTGTGYSNLNEKKALILANKTSLTAEPTSKLVSTAASSGSGLQWDRACNSGIQAGLVQHSLLLHQQKQLEQQNRTCVPVRLTTCFSGSNKRAFLPVNTFASTDAGETNVSREMTANDNTELFPKARLVSQGDSSGKMLQESFQSYKQPKATATSNLQKEADTYLEQQGDTNTISSIPVDIKSLFEYEYDSGPHMSVMYSEFGGVGSGSNMNIVVHEAPPEQLREGLVEYNKVVLKVEASTVSQTDCAIRNGKWDSDVAASLPVTPGVDAIGKIYRIDDETSNRFDLKVGDRVMCLVKWGGNTRYLTVDPSKLVKVSAQVDPAEAVCLAETYLQAFQLLHAGQSKTSRYRPKALQDKTILVLGDMTSNLGRALAKLCFQAGCRNVFGTAKPKHFDIVSSMGVHPIEANPLKWNETLHGSVDLLVHLAGRLSPTVATNILRPTGTIVIATTYGKADGRTGSANRLKPKNLACSRAKATLESRVSRYNVFRAWDEDSGFVQEDLKHLISLLENKELLPHVLDRISLSKVAKAHELLETKRHSGFIVCEPWLTKTLNL